MICAPLQFDVPTITEAELAARFAAERAEHEARVREIVRLARGLRGKRGSRGCGRSGSHARKGPPGMHVFCLEHREWGPFNSAHAAARFLGQHVCAGQIIRAVRTSGTCAGVHWVKVGAA